MGNYSIRWIIFLAVASILGIISIQVFWMQKAITLKEQQFNHRVLVALNNVSTKLIEYTYDQDKKKIYLETIHKKANNYYTIDFSSPVNTTILEELLIIESKNQSLNSNFEYGIFECTSDSFIAGKYIDINNYKNIERKNITVSENENFYIGILFPKRTTFLKDENTLFYLFGGVLLLVFIFFAYTILVIFKQKRLSEVKTDFVNNMTHEFKTPISTIALSSEVLMRDDILNKPKRLKHYATIINEENKRLQKQVESVLQVSQIESKKIVLHKQDIDINELITNIARNFDPRLEPIFGNIILNLNAKKTIIEGDEVHLTNVLYNLIDNAIKYCERIPLIKISTNVKNRGIEIVITDNGKGIPKDAQKMIFDKFFRVSSGNRHDIKGFGLGLFYVKNIVKQHNGKIKLDSVPNEGTTFKIWFKLKGERRWF